MKHAVLLILLQLASSGADAFYTDRAFQLWQPKERNPIAQPFVQTRGGRIAYFSITAGLKIAAPIELRRHQHAKLAEGFAWASIADNLSAAGFTAYRNTLGFPAPSTTKAMTQAGGGRTPHRRAGAQSQAGYAGLLRSPEWTGR